jgi:hypothetical protein
LCSEVRADNADGVPDHNPGSSTTNRNVIYMHIPLGHDLLEITQAQRKSKIPTDAQDDDLGFKMPPLKQLAGPVA